MVLSGRLEAEHIGELEGLFERHEDLPAIVLDLREVRLADRDAVEFLARCESGGMRLENCPAYIREWIGKEKELREQTCRCRKQARGESDEH